VSALDFSCPACKSPPGDWCVYLPPTGRHGEPLEFFHSREHSGRVQAQLDRVGQPTKHLHYARVERYEASLRRRRLVQVVPAGSELVQAARLGLEWDHREYRRLVAWLRAFGGIFDVC
jgi:hypothetical protein